jgi:hypothetical protein
MKQLIPALAMLAASAALAESQPAPSAMFLQRFDANGDRVVSREEFTQPHLQSVNRQFDAMDTNRDGQVDAGEADAFAENMRQHMQQQMQQMNSRGSQQ